MKVVVITEDPCQARSVLAANGVSGAASTLRRTFRSPRSSDAHLIALMEVEQWHLGRLKGDSSHPMFCVFFLEAWKPQVFDTGFVGKNVIQSFFGWSFKWVELESINHEDDPDTKNGIFTYPHLESHLQHTVDAWDIRLNHHLGCIKKMGFQLPTSTGFLPIFLQHSTHKVEPVNPSKKGRDQLGSRYIYIWVVPPRHPKMIIFSRKTHGCWVPPFQETPIYSMHIAAWHLLQHAQVKLRSIRFEEQHVALPGCRKQSGIPLQNSKWLNVSNGQSQIDLIWYSICNISLYISIIFIFVFIYCLYICSNMTDALCWWWMLVPANVNVNSSMVGPGLHDA